MSSAQLERLAEHLLKLRLSKSRERLDALFQGAAAREMAYADFLEQVLAEEVAAKTSNNITMRTAMARFPFVKPLETFDFSYQPSIDRKQVQTLASCHFIEYGDNVLGPPGVGKTHLPPPWGSRPSRRATGCSSPPRPTSSPCLPKRTPRGGSRRSSRSTPPRGS